MPKVFTSKTQQTGELGENLAVRFLMKQGFVIVERNYLRKWGEIDIIAQKEGKLHFVEVKSVSHMPYIKVRNDGKSYEDDHYHPEDNLHPWKLKRLSRVIQTYLLGYRGNRNVSHVTGQGNSEIDWQFDVAVVYLDLKSMEAKVNYMENIIL